MERCGGAGEGGNNGEQQLYGSIKTNVEQDVWTMVGLIWLRIGTNAWQLYTW